MYYNGCFFTKNPSQALSGFKMTPLWLLLRNLFCKTVNGLYFRLSPWIQWIDVAGDVPGDHSFVSDVRCRWSILISTYSYWCLVGNGWQWGNGMIITSVTSDYGSFPHSLLSTSKYFNGKQKNLQPGPSWSFGTIQNLPFWKSQRTPEPWWSPAPVGI